MGKGGDLGIENPKRVLSCVLKLAFFRKKKKKVICPQYFLLITVNSKLDLLAIINCKSFKSARSNKLIFTFSDKNTYFSLKKKMLNGPYNLVLYIFFFFIGLTIMVIQKIMERYEFGILKHLNISSSNIKTNKRMCHFFSKKRKRK